MNFLSAIWHALCDARNHQHRELRNFAKSEYKHDWEWAYQSMKQKKKLPHNK